MALEAEIAEVQRKLDELNARIDGCTTETELNQVGAEIRRVEEQLAPLREAARLHAELEKALAHVKARAAAAPRL